MRTMKKVIAIICALVIIAVGLIVPFNASTGDELTLPSKMTLIDDFEGELTVAGWTTAGNSTFEKSQDYSYGDSGNSLKVTFNSSWPGVKTSTSGRNWLVTDSGIAFWLYAPTALTGGKNLYAKVTLKKPGVTTNAVYEKAIPTNSISVGENIITISWENFVFNKGDNTIKFDDQGVYIYQFELISNFTTENTVYIDNVGIYRDDNAPVEFTPSTVTMPENYLLLDDFNTASAWSWQPHGATLELSQERGYGTEGRSAHVSWSAAGWNGMKTTLTNINLQLKGDGVAFWAYNMTGDLTNFAVVLTQNGVKYEKKITLKAGEAVYKIPFSEFVKNDVSIDATGTVGQIDFTKSSSTANYYIDELVFYNEDGTCVGPHTYDNACDANCNVCDSEREVNGHIYSDILDTDCNVCGAIREIERYASTVELPKNYYPIESFEDANVYGWEGHSATLAFDGKRGYGTEGKSAYVTWEASAWGGFKTTEGSIALKGDGLTFWAYNAGGDLTNFAVVLLQDSVKYEKMITLKAGEAVYTIPFTEFKNGEKIINSSGVISQIDFTKSAKTAEYYLDEISFYNIDGSCVVHIDQNKDYTCEVCNEIFHIVGEWEVEKVATVDADGLMVKKCLECGETLEEKVIPRVLNFRNKTLALESNISIIFRVDSAYFTTHGYINPVVTFNFLGVEYPITEYTVTDKGYEFAFNIVAPHQMKEKVYATLSAEYEGVVYTSAAQEYSIWTYCNNQLTKNSANPAYKKVMALLVDILNYGAAAQNYITKGQIAPEALANAELTDAQKALGNQEVISYADEKQLKDELVEGTIADIKVAGLTLQDSVVMNFKFELLNGAAKDGLVAYVTAADKTWKIEASEFTYETTSGRWVINFNGLNPAQMREKVSVHLEKDGVIVSDTATYSVESYGLSSAAKGDARLAALVEAMAKYGRSAKLYLGIIDEVTATYVWHPGLPNEDVSYDLNVMVNGKTVDADSYTIISDVAGVTAEKNRVTLEYSAREKGDNVIITIVHKSGATCDIIIPCYKWTQTFNDDFDGEELDRTKWTEGTTLTNVAPSNADSYEVIDRAKPAKDCYTVSDGKLNMLIKAEPTYDTNNKIKYLYSECCLRTTEKYDQAFGLFQARIASAEFSGINTAFWLLPRGSYSKYYTNFLSSDPDYGLAEIDIYESSVAFGKYDRRTFAISEHFYDYTNNYEAGNKRSAYYKVDDTITNYHTYSCIWTENALYYYVDNQLIRISDGLQIESSDGRGVTPVNMIVDVSLYLDNAWVGKRDFAESDLPIAGYVDWVRAYQYN